MAAPSDSHIVTGLVSAYEIHGVHRCRRAAARVRRRGVDEPSAQIKPGCRGVRGKKSGRRKREIAGIGNDAAQKTVGRNAEDEVGPAAAASGLRRGSACRRRCPARRRGAPRAGRRTTGPARRSGASRGGGRVAPAATIAARCETRRDLRELRCALPGLADVSLRRARRARKPEECELRRRRQRASPSSAAASCLRDRSAILRTRARRPCSCDAFARTSCRSRSRCRRRYSSCRRRKSAT